MVRMLLAVHVFLVSRTCFLQAHVAVDLLLRGILHRAGYSKFIEVGIVVGELVIGAWLAIVFMGSVGSVGSVGISSLLWTLG